MRKATRSLFCLFAVCLALGGAACLAKSEAGGESSEGLFPIMAFCGPPPSETREERYREMADAGFTHSLTFFANPGEVAAALEVAQRTGIKLLANCPQLLTAEAPSVIELIKLHPALGGYYVMDEPSAKQFPMLSERVRAIQDADPRHACYINLFPNWATPAQLGTATYEEHVRTFLETVPVKYLSFDHYPVIDDGSRVFVRPEWYANLELARAASRERGIAMRAFALSVAHAPYPAPLMAHLRLQVFSDLAYGAQCIQYFTYWTLKSTEWDFHEGPISQLGVKTKTYDLVRQVNKEVQSLREVFLGAEAVSVGHLGDQLPAGTKPYHAQDPIAEATILSGNGEGALIAHLKKGEKSYICIVNKSLKETLRLRLESPRAREFYVVSADGGGHSEFPESGEVEVTPGNICVVGWL